jgi:F-type H+-transporting ATPase subunit b
MPQLDPATPFAPQLIWLLITFLVMFILMWKVALPRIGQVLEARQEKISHDLDRAAKLREEAEEALKAYEAALAEARTSAQSEIAETNAKLQKQAEEREAEVAAKIAKQLEEGESRIAAARDSAMKSVRDVAVDVARSATERLVGSAPDDEALGKAVDATLQERG